MYKKKKFGKFFSVLVFCASLAIFLPATAQETVTAEETVVEEENQSTEETIASVEENIQSAEESESETEVTPLPNYTWADFLTNKDCRPLIREIASRPEYKELYQNLRVSCLEEKPLAWNYLLNVFRKEKRNLLIKQTMNSSSSYTRYIKVIPYLLFDIQNTKPVGNKPVDILDKAEQAIADHQIGTALSLIDGLPDTWKDQFKNSQLICKRLLRLEELLNDLNKSENGGQND